MPLATVLIEPMVLVTKRKETMRLSGTIAPVHLPASTEQNEHGGILCSEVSRRSGRWLHCRSTARCPSPLESDDSLAQLPHNRRVPFGSSRLSPVGEDVPHTWGSNMGVRTSRGSTLMRSLADQ